MESNRREFIGGTIAGAIGALVESARAAVPQTDEPMEPAVFLVSFPPGESVDATGKAAQNYELAIQIIKGLRRPTERWVVIPAEEWGISCVPDRPHKICERFGVLFEFEEGKPTGKARVWDEHTGREFHQVKHCNTATGEICYYRNTDKKIDVPLVVITEWVEDLRVRLEGEEVIYRREPR